MTIKDICYVALPFIICHMVAIYYSRMIDTSIESTSIRNRRGSHVRLEGGNAF